MTALALALGLGMSGWAQAGQTGGQVVAGSGSIAQDGAVTTITQTSQQLSLNWQSFNIDAGETVNFIQPGASSIAVNRVLGNSASEIFGNLNANGQVWLINPNGVLFGKNAQVDVGGIVASTLDTSDASLFSATRHFNGDGHGSVVNRGRINVHGGGYVALLGHQVSNQGSISARLGTVAMGAGSAITLTFEGNQLLHLQVDRSTLDDLVENRQLIQADGGRVMLTAGAAESLLASSVNNTGVVRAQTVDNHNGEITLLAGATAGTTHVAGTLDASAPVGGDGGFVETSAAQVDVAGDAHINASAAQGTSGQWLLDPTDLNIDAALAGSIASTLNGGTNVIQQTSSGPGAEAGDINVNAAINWTNAAAALTLDAYHSVNVNAPINGAGTVLMQAGADINLAAAVAGNAGVTLKAAGNFINTAGAGALSASAGKWLVYSTNPTASSTGGLAADFIQYDMTSAGTPTATGNGFVYSVAPTVNFTGLTGTVTKDYDGTNAATLTGGNFTSAGMLAGDKLVSAKGTYASVNAGTGIDVTMPTVATDFTFADAGGTPIYGYKVSGLPLTANVGTIDPKALTVSIIGTPTKVYNATTTAMLVAGNYAVDGVVAGEGVNFSQPSAVSYDSADAGARTVTATFLPSNFVAAPGTYLTNYILPTSATGAGQINQAPLELSGLLAQDKTYDGTAAAALDKGGASIFGVVAADVGQVGLDTSAGTGTFASANAGTWNVTTSGFTLTGSKAANYLLIAPVDLKATINKKALGVSNVTALDKVYDATTTASLDVASAALGAGVLAGDDVTLSTTGATGAFGSANVGTGLGVTVNGFALAGTAANNYSLAQPTGLSADITPAPLTITVTGNPTRTYNGTSLALVGESDFTISGWQGSDNGKITQNAGASYASPDASASNLVTVLLEAPDFVMSSGSLSNYAFASAVFGNGTISPITLTYALVGNPTKTYDGTTDATLVPGNYKLDGFLAGEGATVTQTHGTYADPNVGQWLVTANLTAADFSLFGGAKLVNYVWPTLVTGFGTITPAPLGGYIYASIDGPTKVYDGTTDAVLTPGNFTLTGFAAGEGATVNQTVGTFADKNVGLQAVSAVLTPGNFDADPGTILSNYTLPTMAYGTGEITPAPLIASIIGTPTKVYDGGTYVVLDLANYKLDGFVAGEGADINPPSAVDFDDKNVGTPGITATLAPSSYVAHAGTLLSNYILADTATGAGMIIPAPLYVNGVSATSRVYDTTNIAQLTGTGKLVGLVLADVGKVTLTSGTTGTFAQADVGNGIGVTANGFSISGAESSNYTLLPLAGLTANITPFKLTINGVTADDREYDGSTDITLNNSAAILSGMFVADSADVTLDTVGALGHTRSANVGTDLAVSTSGFTLGGAKAHNYVVDQVGGLKASITPKALTGTIIGDPTKPYDGTGSVTLTGGNFNLAGFAPGEGISVPQTSNASYDNVNAGSNRGLTAYLVVSDFLANVGTSLSNYTLPTEVHGAGGTITQAIISLQGTRVYNALTDANASLFTTGGLIDGVDGEKLTLTGSGILTTKNVGSQRPFADLSGFTLGGSGGSDAANYTLVGGVDWVTITPKLLQVGGLGADNKTYDGNRTAILNGTATGDQIAGDDITFGNTATGLFDTKNVGTGKSVATAVTLGGADAGNYTVVQQTGITADISRKTITVDATGKNKAYDGNVDSGATLSSADKVSGDALGYSSTSNVFADKNVATGIDVTVSGIGLTGADAGNYTLASTTATTTANITPHILNLSGTRVYNALTDAGANLFGNKDGTINGVAGETLTLTGSGLLGNKNVGTNKAFTQDTLALGDGTGGGVFTNYAFGTYKLTVTKANLTVSGTTAANKIYDGTRDAALSGATLDGVLLTDAVTLGNATAGLFDTKDVGTNKPVTTAFTIGGTDASNYNILQPAGITADITKLAVVVKVEATGKDKVYDGTTHSDATLDSADFVTGDDVSLTNTSNEFVSKDVGSNILVNIAGISLAGGDAGNYDLSGVTTATTTANITPYVINLQGTRVYDATTGADYTLFGNHDGTINGIVGETLALSGSGTLGDKDVGTKKAVTSFAGLTLGNDGTSLAGNYTFTGGTHWVTVTPYALTVTATAANKIYDRLTTASTTLTSSPLLGGDVVMFSPGAANFSDKNVANGKTVTVTGITSTGDPLGNYTFNTTAIATANITPLAITGAITANNKVYNAGVDATTAGTLTGVLGGDVLTFGTTGTFSDKNVANGKTVTVSGSLSGTDAGNYTLTSNTTTLANITPLAITVSATAANKVYDGNDSADATLAGGGVLAGDTVVFSAASATFSDKNVANGKTVSVHNIVATGADAGNYTVNTSTTTTADITPLAITGAITASNKIYNAGVDATTMGTLTGVLGSDTVTFGTTGTFSDKNVADGKTVTVNGSLGGVDAGNYTLTANTTTLANITPLAITGSILADNKVYDATTAATVHGTLTGMLGGDVLTYDTTGTFSDKNVANGKTVTVTGSLGGTDAGNYTLTSNATTLANITPLAITGSILADNKVYDATTAATVHGTLTGVLGGDVLTVGTVGGTFSDKDAGIGKTVNVTGAVAGADQGNYAVSFNPTTTADITRAIVNLSGTRVYNGNATADAGIFGTAGIVDTGVAGEQLGLIGSGILVDKDVSLSRPLNSLGTLALTDHGVSLAKNYTLVGGAHVAAVTPFAITGTITADGKIYDGGTVATIHGSFTGAFAGDDLGLSSTGSFADKNAGTGKLVNVSGSLTGTDAGNYTLTSNTTTLADITPLAITGSILADNKVYDATTAATVHGTLTGVLGGDVLTFGTSGTFSDKNVADGKTVTVTGSLGGADAGNYTLTSNTTTLANITPLAITGSILADNKVYDATTAATVHGTLTGVLGGDVLTYDTNGTFSDKNVADGKTVTVTGSLGGADAGNYTLTSNPTTLANITPLAITGDILADDKVYDGTTVATIHGALTGTVLAGDDLSLGTLGSFADKNAGTDKLVNVSGSLTGTDAGNYTLIANTTTLADITPLAITGSILADNKVYDATTAATVHGTLTGVLGGDVLTFDTNGTFSDKNVADGKTVTVTGSLGGADAGNYTLIANTTTTANITPLTIDVLATGVDKFFDGSRQADASLTGQGVLAGDAVAFDSTSKWFADPAPGSGKTITISDIFATGADASNYAFNHTATATANILPLANQQAGSAAYTQLGWLLRTRDLATPYGVGPAGAANPFAGNQKGWRQPVEANAMLPDFYSGLALRVVDGGVAAPRDAM